MLQAVSSFPLVELPGPASLGERGVEREVDQRLMECMIAGSALPDGLGLPRRHGHRGYTATGSEFLPGWSMFPVLTEDGQQTGNGNRSPDRQRPKDIGIGMLDDPFFHVLFNREDPDADV